MTGISRENAPIPLYHQLKTRLIELIRSGKVKPGDTIAPEQKLCSEFGVSRGTVRTAVSELVKEGFLQREQGRGTFVMSPGLENSLLAYFRFTEKGSSEAVVPASKVIKARKVTPPLEVAQFLQLTPKESVIEIRRLRLVKGTPFIHQVSFFPESLFPGLEYVEKTVPSLYDYISKRYGIRVVEVDEYLTAGLADKEIRQLLNLRNNSPVIIIERIAYTFDEKPMEYRRSIGRADQYYYHTRL